MASPLLIGLGRRFDTARYWVREFFGENEYARYVADWQARHAAGDHPEACSLVPGGEHRMMSEREFFDYRLNIKYGGAIQRC